MDEYWIKATSPLGAGRALAMTLGGIVLPLLAMAVETSSHLSNRDLFPTPMNVALVLLVPITHLLYLLGLGRERSRFLTGVALGTCLVYCLPFLAILPLAIVAVAFMGFGLLPLSPFLAALATLTLMRHQRATRQTMWGCLASFLVLGLCQGLLSVSALLLENGNPTCVRALRLLTPPAVLQRVASEATRGTLYRVTGESASARPAAWSQRTGELNVASCTLEGWVDSDAALAYLEYAFEASNSGVAQQEGWLRVALPPGGAVCRATLWVNGKPREAMFASTSRARHAYQQVTASRRDPLLVTAAGPGQAELRFSPVVPGTPMRMVIGITVPLTMTSRERARIDFPSWCDGNLGLPAETSIWLHGNHPLSILAPSSGWRDSCIAQPNSLCGHLSDANGALVVEALRDAAVGNVCCRLLDGHWLSARMTEEPPGRLAVVVDGSRSLREHRREVEVALRQLAPAATVLATDEGPRELGSGDHIDFTGGQDNLPALRRACELADTVVWLRGPQEQLLSDPVPLQRWLETAHKRIFEVPLVGNAGDQAMEQLRLPGLRTWPCYLGLEPLRHQTLRWSYSPTPLRPNGPETSDHLARLWVMEQCDHLDVPESVQMASQYRLVTRWSSAVVLDTDAAYKDNGLKTGASGSRAEEQKEGAPPPLPGGAPVGFVQTTSVPEPETWVLVLLVAAGLRRRARK